MRLFEPLHAHRRTLRAMRVASFVALTVFLAACTGSGTGTTTVDQTSSTSAPAPTSTLPPVVECPGVGEFEEGGGIADVAGEGSDSHRIGKISWETNDQCETFHLEFETSEGAPATTVPAIQVDHLESFQVVRIDLGVDGTVVSDQLVESNLVSRLYVVSSLGGRMFVDLHLREPAAVRASVSSSPARLTLDLRPGFVPFTGSSTIGDNIVLTSPAAGSTVGRDVQLLGYARSFEGDVLAVATRDGEVVAESSAGAVDATATWGEYRLELGLPPPGPVSVFVGEESPDDGLEGITVDLTVS